MKVILLAGGLGTRISEESDYRPKPMVEIGGKPLLWHIMKYYSNFGFREFVICLGYKGHVIKEFFLDYVRFTSDLRIDLKTHSVDVLRSETEDWEVTLIDTGVNTMTGGRLKRVANILGDDTFCMTYGDGLANVDLRQEVDFHQEHRKMATVLAVQPPGRFGVLDLDDAGLVNRFEEKPSDEIGWINGGFFVLEPKIMDYISGDAMPFEKTPMSSLAKDGELMAFKHIGFWQPCDTLRDKRYLEELWETNRAPWAIWQ